MATNNDDIVKHYAPVDEANHGKASKKTVDYIYDIDIGNYSYSAGHPMKQHRVRLAHSLIMNYGLYTKMKILRAKPASKLEMTQFHADDYVEFLSKVTHENMGSMNKDQMRFNVGDDSPVFDGLFEYCAISAGGSLEGAARLGRGKCDIAVNWAGGLHHAKKSEASGFCYINDIVLAIIELLRYHQRVLYIDIDVHHGDGVEEAFFTTDRVMTVSFHQYGEFFPGTGELRDIGTDKGKNYSVNFPLRHGIDDASYKGIFEPVISKVMEHYQPGAIVLQCGGDSLSGDRLGSLNLSMRGHANCVTFVKSFGVPVLLLGGGGYTMRNVSRTWAYETGLAIGVDLPAKLPAHEYSEYYGPDYELDVKASDMQNQNSVEYLEKIKIKIFENLKETTFVPSVEMQDIPRISFGMDDEDDAMLDDLDEDENPDVRMTQRRRDGTIEASGELSESEDESNDPKGKKLGGRRNEENSKETGSGLSDIDESGSRSSEVSTSPKSNANDSEGEDIEMKDAGEVIEEVVETEKHTNGTSEKGDNLTSKEQSRSTSEVPNREVAIEPGKATSAETTDPKKEAAMRTTEKAPDVDSNQI